MKKKWIAIPSLLVLIVIGAVATMPIWKPVWDEHGPGPNVAVDRALRVEAIDTLVAKLNDHYIFPDQARQMEALLRQHQRERKYDGITDGKRLAEQLTDDLQDAAHDLHMEVLFSRAMVPPDDAGAPPPASQEEWERRTNLVMRLVMRGVASRRVEKVDHLSPNIGHLKIVGFPASFLIADRYAAAMAQLADTDGLIVDLRENRGGSSESVALLISYLLDQRTHLNDIWDRDTGMTTQHWTEDMPGAKRYGSKKPILVLVGPATMSAGEDFAYTLQALKRATVVGMPTWGAANPSRPYRLGDHFFAMIPARRLINPITHTNWEGVGVKPDIAAAPDDALALATDLMQRRLHDGVPLAAVGR